MGPLTIECAYYHCAACGHSLFPRDRARHGVRRPVSRGTRRTGAAAALGRFAQTSGLLGDLADIRVGVKRTDHTAEALGRDLGARDRQGPAQPVPASA